jgi:hypothetical protein
MFPVGCGMSLVWVAALVGRAGGRGWGWKGRNLAIIVAAAAERERGSEG